MTDRYEGPSGLDSSQPCSTCARPRRERGEVRRWVWLCGCAIVPQIVDEQSVDSRDPTKPRIVVVIGYGVCTAAPTRERAIAEWRTKVEAMQSWMDTHGGHR